ncbi:MAG: response regulator [Bacteroidota bacterium]|nr:response regulator [Bacteroidota bacterium]
MRILLLEDNSFDADLISREIEKNIPECSIELATSLNAARNLLQVNQFYDAAILDVNLPDGSGLVLLMEIRERYLPMTAIVLTGYGNEELAVAAMKAGADDFVIKSGDFGIKLTNALLYHNQSISRRIQKNNQVIRVLYTEHHPADVDLTVRHFGKYAPNFHFEHLPDAQKLLEYIKANTKKVETGHILLIDYRLPGIDGLELTKTIRQELKLDIPIVIVTGQGNEEIAIQALNLGVDDYVVKRENYVYRLPSLLQNVYQRWLLEKEQKELQKSKNELEEYFENDISADYVVSLEGEIYSCNKTFLTMFGFENKTHTEKFNITDLYKNPDDRKELLRKVKATGKVENYELEFITLGGSKMNVLVNAIGIFNGSGELVQTRGYAVDITNLKRIEEELAIAKDRAEESDRLKSAFLANMSHEIRTPMNGILGFAELLKEPELTGEQQQEYIRIIEKSGARMLNIINDIVDISKIESGQMKVSISPTNVNEQIEFIYTLFKKEVEQKGLQFFTKNSLPSKEAIILTDREKFFAILANLVKNAIKYTKEGAIEFGYDIVGTLHATSLQFYVKDTGIGIRNDRQDAIFERFMQADIVDKMARQGAGLGLAISKAYVEMLGGRIWVESEEGKGSTFYFTLQFHTEPKDVNVTNNEFLTQTKENQMNQLKVLIAEDDVSSEKLMSIVVRKFAKEIIQVETGTEAVEACRTNPDIDLILMDILMPDIDGYEATRQIREFNTTVVIIAQTAYALSGDREKAIEAGCNDYISKPIRKDNLMELIQKYF